MKYPVCAGCGVKYKTAEQFLEATKTSDCPVCGKVAQAGLVKAGLCNEDGTLTDAGMLRLVQLKTLEYTKRVTIPKRLSKEEAKRARRESNASP